MPQPDGGAQTQTVNAIGITFTDWNNRKLSQTIPTSGGSTTMGAAEDLAEAIANCSNACFSELRNNETKKWKVGDLRTLDEASDSVESVIVLVFAHDTDPDKNHEVLIPAYDAQFILEGGGVWLSNAAIQNVIDKALDILNDDGDALNPDDYHAENVRAFTSKRKVSGGKSKSTVVVPLAEADSGTTPDEQPGENP